MIVALALRMAATRALTHETIAKANVHDSAIGSLDALLGEKPTPFIVVSTDDQNFEPIVRSISSGQGRCDLVIDAAVGSAVTLEDGGLAVVVPHNDAGTEMSVNIMTRQIMRALFEPNSGGKWGAIFRKIACNATRVIIRRGAGSEKGIRFAAAQIVVTVSTIDEPAFGRAPEDVWAEFLAVVRDDPSVAPLADAIEAVIVGTPVVDWRFPASLGGLSDEGAAGVGIAPVIIPFEDPALAQEITISGIGTISEEGAEEQVP